MVQMKLKVTVAEFYQMCQFCNGFWTWAWQIMNTIVRWKQFLTSTFDQFFLHIKALTAVTLNQSYFIVVGFDLIDFNNNVFYEVQPMFGALSAQWKSNNHF